MWSGDRENLGCNENSHHMQINENLTAALPPHLPRIQTWVLVWALLPTHRVILNKSLFALEPLFPHL